jgi:hypothetical protein
MEWESRMLVNGLQDEIELLSANKTVSLGAASGDGHRLRDGHSDNEHRPVDGFVSYEDIRRTSVMAQEGL